MKTVLVIHLEMLLPSIKPEFKSFYSIYLKEVLFFEFQWVQLNSQCDVGLPEKVKFLHFDAYG